MRAHFPPLYISANWQRWVYPPFACVTCPLPNGWKGGGREGKGDQYGWQMPCSPPTLSLANSPACMLVVMYCTMWDKSKRFFPPFRAHLDYVTQPCDIGHMIIWSLFNNELAPLKTKSPANTSPHPTPSLEPPPDFVLRGPNPLLKVTKLSCVRHHMVSWFRHVRVV